MIKNDKIPKPPEEMVAYYKSLNDLINSQTNNLKLVTINKIEGIEKFLKTISKESSLLEDGFVSVDSEQVAKNFKELVVLLKSSSAENELAVILENAIESKKFEAELWNDTIENVEQKIVAIAEQLQVDIHSVLQLAYWSMCPYWRLVASDNKEVIGKLETNERATCPVCGKFADFATLDDKKHGRRYLVCLHCDITWPYKRMGCSYCGNDDYDKLGYILVDDLEGYKIYHCEECKSYLKTFDRRADVARLSDNNLIENVETLFLDLLAVEKGYKPMT